MTDLEVYKPPVAAEVVLASDIDSWTQIAGKVINLAKEIADTPFVPDGLRGSVPAVAAAILAGRELGLAPLTSLANIHVIKGKPSLSAALMRALILAQGHQIETVDISDRRAVVRGRRKGESSWEEASFTAEQARQANISLGGYPQDKLYARATSRLARRKFADVIAGMPYSAEELEDEPGDTPAIEAKPTGRVTAAEITGRTAAPQTASPAAASSPDASSDSPLAEPAGEAPDETVPESRPATTPQITAIWTVLNTVFKFGSDEKDQARLVCAHIVGHDLASTKDMTKDEAKDVIDTLSSWRETAEQHEEAPRDFLIQLLATGEVPGDA